MPQNFEKNSSQPDAGNQLEIETLLATFYSDARPDPARAERLWQRLGPQLAPPQKTAPVGSARSGGWFNFLPVKRNLKRSNELKNASPLIERDETDFQAGRIRPRSRAGSLLGGLAALALALGLVAIFALNAGKGPSGNPGIGGQPVATNTLKPEASPTPPPYDSRSPFPATVAPNASPTPVPYTTPDGSPIPTFESRPAPTPTFDPKASPTPVPFDGKTTVPASNNPGATLTPLPATVTAPGGTDTTTLNLYGVENVAVNGLANVPVAFDYKTLPEHMLATNPQVHFYASKNDPATILSNLSDALLRAGYEVTPPLNITSWPAKLPAGGIYITAKKTGQPDLYINLVSIASAAEVSNLSKTAYYSGGIDFENGANNLRVKGYKNLLLVLSGNNLLQAITGGGDPGADSPTGTPNPVK